MRSFFFLQLQKHLEGLTDDKGETLVKTYDLWNEQVDFIEEEEPFARPAVFLEFMPYNGRCSLPPHRQQPFPSGCMWLPIGKVLQGREADTRSKHSGVLICWINSAGICITSWEMTAKYSSICSGVPPAIRTTIMQK